MGPAAQVRRMIALLIPTGSDHDRTRIPTITLSLITINVLIYFVSNLLNYQHIAQTFGFVAAHPQPWQFLTYMFLHAGWPTEASAPWTDYVNSVLHIGGNMLYLWFAGSDLEDVMGKGKFLLIYFVSGIASALLYWLTAVVGHFPNLDEPCVGASGAIAGLLGYYLVRFPRFKVRMWFGAATPIPFIMRQGITRISSLIFIGFWIVLQLVFGVMALHSGRRSNCVLGTYRRVRARIGRGPRDARVAQRRRGIFNEGRGSSLLQTEMVSRDGRLSAAGQTLPALRRRPYQVGPVLGVYRPVQTRRRCLAQGPRLLS